MVNEIQSMYSAHIDLVITSLVISFMFIGGAWLVGSIMVQDVQERKEECKKKYRGLMRDTLKEARHNSYETERR